MHFNHNLVKNNDGILKTLVFRSVLLGSVSHETFMMYVGSQQGGEGGRPHALKVLIDPPTHVVRLPP